MAPEITEYSKVSSLPKVMHVLPSRDDGSMPYNLIYLPQSKRMKLQDPIYLCDSSVDILQKIKTEDDVVLHFHDLYSAFRYLKNRLNKSRYVITVHNDFWYLNYKNKLKLLLLLRDDRCCSIIFCSKAAARGLNNVCKKIIFVDNGYPFCEQPSKRSLECKEQEILLFCKSDDYQKRNHELLEKLTSCNAYRFHLVGYIGSRLRRAIMNSNLSIISHGIIPRAEVENLQKKSQIVVSNARYEGLPLAILESINYGAMPLLVSNSVHRYMIPAHLHKYFIFDAVTKDDFELKLNNMLTQNNLHSAFLELQTDTKKRFNQIKMLKEYELVYASI